MIAKVIAWGPDRATAIDRLVGALDGSIVEGLKSNRAFLARLANHPAFRAGEVDTGFIPRHADALAPPVAVPDAALALAALAIVLDTAPAGTGPFARSGFRLNLPEVRTIRLWNGATLHSLGVRSAGGRYHLSGLDSLAELGARRDGLAISLDAGGTPIAGHVVHGEDAIEVRLAGQTYRLATRAPLKAAQAGPGDGRIIAPMPGRVLAVDVVAGQSVAAGDRLLVLEAMKMEHRITARAAGVVTAINVAAGDQVADGMLLVEIGAG